MGFRKIINAKVLLVLVLLSGCSTFKKTALSSMAGGFAGGALMGAATAPDGDKREMHGLLWGSLTAALVGATLVYLHDEGDLVEEKNRQIKVLQIENSSREGKREISSGNSNFFQDDVPSEVSRLVQPGKWTLYETDKWQRTQKNKFIHQNKILEFNPPRIGESL